MTVRRPKPVEYPRPNAYTPGSFGEQHVFGTCEGAECAWVARATCSRCGGQFCLRHEGHPEHAD